MRPRLLISKSCYDISKTRERLVDLLGFLQSLSCSSCNPNSLRTCQVYKIKLPDFDLLWRVFPVLHVLILIFKVCHLLDNDDENSMGPTWEVIHLCCSCSSAESTFLHQTVDLIRGSDSPFTQTFHKNSFLLVLSDLETCSVYLEQVTDDFVVYLKITRSYHECSVLRRLHLNKSKYLLHWSWNYTSLRISCRVFKAFHCVSFSCACLTIGQDSSIVTFKYAKHSLLCSILIHILLCGLLVVDVVEGEVLPND